MRRSNAAQPIAPNFVLMKLPGESGTEFVNKIVNTFVRSEFVALANKTIDSVELFCSLRLEIGSGCASDDPDDVIFVFPR
jgi:hypothetical protein